jgi:hypothetical protein
MAYPPRNWPDWRCCLPTGQPPGWCNLPATRRAHPLEASSTWWHYCDKHAPADAEPIPRRELYYTVRVIGVLELAGLPGDPDDSVDELLRRLQWAVEAAGGRLTVAATRVQVTAPAAAGAPPLRLVGREGEEWPPELPAPVRQPGRPAWLSWPRSRRRA